MFEMTVEDVIKVNHMNVLFGVCNHENLWWETQVLKDDDGNLYETERPLNKTLVYDPHSIILGIKDGDNGLLHLKGKTLRGVAT